MATSQVLDLNEIGALDVELVDLIRANPTLYEKEVRSTPYDSTKRKTELWRSIAVSVGLETSYCIVRWRNLRDKFRREYWRCKETQQKSIWPLFEKMRFLENNIKYYGLHQAKVQTPQKSDVTTTTWHIMDAEQLIEETIALDDGDDPFQEAMDESTVGAAEKVTEICVTTTTNYATPTTNAAMRRIEVLLEGLDNDNRQKAEKRIVAYLCKCQLKALNSEDVDDILI